MAKAVAMLAPLFTLILLAPLGVLGTDVCGTGAAVDFPNKCWFNDDPAGRYVCCDNQGCDGFNADNNIPHCKNFGYIPPNFGVPVSRCGDLCTSNSAPNRCCNADGSTGVCCPGSCGPSIPALGGTVATCLHANAPAPVTTSSPVTPTSGPVAPTSGPVAPTPGPVATTPPTCNCPNAIGTVPPQVYCDIIDFNTTGRFNECPYKKDGFQLDSCFVSPQPPLYPMGALYCCIDQPPYDQLCGNGQSTCCLDHERGGVYCVPTLQEIYDFCSKTPAPTTPAPINPAPTTAAPTPTTAAPTPTTAAPTPTTAAPTPTTAAPTPTTAAPTPTTAAPTPTTAAPTPTTAAPTNAPSTLPPTPTTAAPTPAPTGPPFLQTCTANDGTPGICDKNCGGGTSGCNCLDVQFLTGMCVVCQTGVTGGLPGNPNCVVPDSGTPASPGVPAIPDTPAGSNGLKLCKSDGTTPCVEDTNCNNSGGGQCPGGNGYKCCHFPVK